MNPIHLSGSGLTNAIATANTMAHAVGGTFSGNAGWLVLIACASLIFGVIGSIMIGMSRLGRGGIGPTDFDVIANAARNIGERHEDSLPLAAYDLDEYRRTRKRPAGWSTYTKAQRKAKGMDF